MLISIIICTYNPHEGRLRQTLAGLTSQTLPAGSWELCLIDNNSTPAIDTHALGLLNGENFKLLNEPKPGLAFARKTGLRATKGEIIVFVDDDNVLHPDYLQQTLATFARLPRVGALGGKSIPSFESMPPAWASEFHSLLALRDLGDAELISNGLRPQRSINNNYPLFAPIGAGMAIRREAIQSWLKHESALSDRRGNELTSSGDNDMVLSIMEAGWEVAYSPLLNLTHLIPASRLDKNYLARLNRGIRKSWVQVLLAHDACPWPQVPRWTVPMRQIKAWLTHRAWSSSAAHIRWQGACGQFEGLANIPPYGT